MKSIVRAAALAAIAAQLYVPGCAPSTIKPVDIHPEDACANCRMAVSDKAFASEIILQNGEALKFDDLVCLEDYRKKEPTAKIAAIFVSDYETKEWLAFEKSIIVETGIATPMGSGKIAVKDEARAKALREKYPSTKSLTDAGCCTPK